MKKRIDKKSLWIYINKKINRAVHHYHVFSVLSLLVEEILQDLKQGKNIKIFNFGNFQLLKNKPMVITQVDTKQKVLIPGTYRIKFKISPRLRKKISNYLDFDKISENN